MRRYSTIPGYKSIEDIVSKLNSFDDKEFRSVLHYFGEGFKSQYYADLKEGGEHLHYFYELSKLTDEIDPIYFTYYYKGFGYNLSLLKFDSMKEVFDKLNPKGSYKYVKRITTILSELVRKADHS